MITGQSISLISSHLLITLKTQISTKIYLIWHHYSLQLRSDWRTIDLNNLLEKTTLFVPVKIELNFLRILHEISIRLIMSLDCV